jgi:hypothetical protein
MLEIIELLTHYFVTLIKLLQPGGVKVVMAESIAMKHQLIVMNRARRRSPALVTRDRFLFGLLVMLVGERVFKRLSSSFLGMKTPRRMAAENFTDQNVVSLDHCRWESRCNGLYQLPVAA